MKISKIVLILALIYAGIVATFESLIGYMQPENDGTLVIVTRDDEGEHPRVLSRIDLDGVIYVAVNHWPRGWYHRLLENPDVQVEIAGVTALYTAVDVTDSAEREMVNATRPLGLGIRFVTGFPPREFVRLDPLLMTEMTEMTEIAESAIESGIESTAELSPPLELESAQDPAD